MRKLTTLVVLALMLGTLIAGVVIFGGDMAQAVHPGTTVFVDDATSPATGSGTAADPFSSIQVAVDHAAAGDTVLVSPGYYQETVEIGGKDGLTLQGVSGSGQPIIDAGQGPGDPPMSTVSW